MNKGDVTGFYNSHKGGINGALIGLVIAVMILLIGFFRTFFIIICMGVGYYLGKRIFENRDYVKNLLDRFLPPGTYR